MTTEYSTCVRNSEGVTYKIVDCISAEFDPQDSRLNEAYKKLITKLPKDRKKSLEAPRAWIKFREANCGFYHDPNGGSGAHMAGNECFINATVDRTKELETTRRLKTGQNARLYSAKRARSPIASANTPSAPSSWGAF